MFHFTTPDSWSVDAESQCIGMQRRQNNYKDYIGVRRDNCQFCLCALQWFTSPHLTAGVLTQNPSVPECSAGRTTRREECGVGKVTASSVFVLCNVSLHHT